MTTSFEKYSDILFDAYQCNPILSNTTSNKKILEEIFQDCQVTTNNILFVGFSPWIFSLNNCEIYVTEISQHVQDALTQQGIKFTYIVLSELIEKQFNVVVAIDEYFTFVQSDQEQRFKIKQLSSMAKDCIVTSLSDYKNQDLKDKEFSHPVTIYDSNSKKIFFEHYEYSTRDRSTSVSTSYIIDDSGVAVIGPFDRRVLYFKQLAKFSIDSGAKSFLVHKQLMHKSMIKKNYEHIIIIKFSS